MVGRPWNGWQQHQWNVHTSSGRVCQQQWLYGTVVVVSLYYASATASHLPTTAGSVTI